MAFPCHIRPLLQTALSDNPAPLQKERGGGASQNSRIVGKTRATEDILVAFCPITVPKADRLRHVAGDVNFFVLSLQINRARLFSPLSIRLDMSMITAFNMGVFANFIYFR